MTGVLQITQC